MPPGQALRRPKVERPYSTAKVTYLCAFYEFGTRLPTIREFGGILSSEELAREAKPGCPAWALELLGKPEKGKRLRRNEDLVDFKSGWRVPGSFLMEARGDAFAPGIGLLIVPERFETGEKPVVIPKAILVVQNLQASLVGGAVDEETGLVVKAKGRDEEAQGSKKHGIMLYHEEQSLRPISTGFFLFRELAGCVNAVAEPDARFGVVVLEPKHN